MEEEAIDAIDPTDLLDTERMVHRWLSPTFSIPRIGEEAAVLYVYCQHSIDEATEATHLSYFSHIFHRDCIVECLTPRIRGSQNRLCPACHYSVYTSSPCAQIFILLSSPVKAERYLLDSSRKGGVYFLAIHFPTIFSALKYVPRSVENRFNTPSGFWE